MGRAFNSMLESIARMMRELSQREAVAAMGEIAATMAHQVRSPATAIRIDVQRAHDKLPANAPERALLARALVWAATEPRCANRAFNITNGDLVRWCHLWPGIAAALEVEPGPVQQTLDVDPLDVGSYFYLCDVHPNMTGTLVTVDAGGGGGGGGGGGNA